MKKAISLTLALTAVPALALADPVVFGLEIGKTTVAEFAQKYPGISVAGINKYSDGKQFALSPSEIPLNGLKTALAIFDHDEVLTAVAVTVHKNRFNDLHSMLRDKYQLVSQNVPPVGNKIAEYRDGKTTITLDAPHMSFDMQMNYLHDEFKARFTAIEQLEARQKAQAEADLL